MLGARRPLHCGKLGGGQMKGVWNLERTAGQFAGAFADMRANGIARVCEDPSHRRGWSYAGSGQITASSSRGRVIGVIPPT